MKCMSSFIILFFIANNLFAQLWWASINGETEFCPGDDRTEIIYSLNDNFTTTITYNISCTRCEMRVLNSNDPWLTSLTGLGSPNFTQIEVNWDSGNHDDAKLRYEIYGHWMLVKDKLGVDEHDIILVDTDVTPTITSNVSTISCGSTSPITFTANWKNADSYDWDVTGGVKSGCTTCAILTVIPNGTSNVTAKVKGINTACNVESNQAPKTVTINPPSVNAISGPSYVCFNAPSIETHSVNYIPGATYEWYASDNTFMDEKYSASIYAKAKKSGSFILNVKVTACGATPVIKSKNVTATNSAPAPPVIYQYPYQHCAGSCASYSVMLPTGYASEKQFRYNYGNWDVANSSGSISVCTNSWDGGYRPIELRSKGICGNYGSSNTQSVEIDNCGGYYMMATSEQDSLTISQMSKKEEVVLFPNPATTSMTIRLPEDMTETEVAIISDKSEVIANFKNSKSIFTINTSKLGTGFYYLSVGDKNKKTTKRFVVE